MIPFEEIDKRLKAIEKNRIWLAEATGRSQGSIRSALARNAHKKHRSDFLQKALSDAIEAEENRRETPLSNTTPDTITLIPSDDQYRRWSEAQKESQLPTLKDWAIHELNRAAAEWAREKATRTLHVAEDPVFYGSNQAK